MINSYSVPLSQLVKEFNLRPVHKSTDFEQTNITVDDISRPGLQMAGYFDHFEPMRLQVIGTVETTYLNKLHSEKRTEIFDRFFSYKIPALIISRDLEPLPECLQMAEKHDITILQGSDFPAPAVRQRKVCLYSRQKLFPDESALCFRVLRPAEYSVRSR